MNNTSQQTGWIIAITDRTKEMEIEDMKVDFVATAAHELRTPLTAIRGYTEVLQDEHERLSADGRTYLQRLGVSAQYLARIIDNIISTSNIEKHLFTINCHPLDLIPLIEDVLKNLSLEAADHKLSIELVKPSAALSQVSADPIRLKEVVSNLLTNAIHFTPDGGTISIHITQQNDMVTVAIRDTGIGIPKEAMPQLFTKFYRVAKALKEGTKGPGLGLFISKTVIELHKGRIWVESEVGKGSTFYFSIPIIIRLPA